MNVTPGFWRRHNLTDAIEPCENLPANCLGGTQQFTCYEGHIGALCESCDNYGDTWGHKWANTGTFTCGKCQDDAYPLAMVVIVTIYATIMTAIEVMSGFEAVEAFTLNFYLASRGWNPLDLSGIFIKIVVNWQQILNVVTTFDLDELPKQAADSA